MLDDQLRKEIKSLLDKNDQAISDVDPLVTSGKLNSLKIVELATWIEKNYGVDFGKIGLNVYDFETIEKIIELIKNNRR